MLYTWPAAMNGSTGSYSNPSEVQGVCPDGWHLPSDEEWKELEIFLGMAPDTVDIIGLRGTDIGSKLASSSEGWVDGYLDGNPVFGSSGLNAKPGGGRRYDGTFGHKGDNANFWTATEYSNILHGAATFTPLIPRYTVTKMPSPMASRCAVLRIIDYFRAQ